MVPPSIATAGEDPETWLVCPTPGYVIKFKEVDMIGLEGKEKRKCFVNLCHCTQLPPPTDDIEEDELAQRIDAGDFSFKIPLSIGEIDCVKDNKNDNALKIDVLLNSVFYEKRLSTGKSEFYRHFVCLVLSEAIEKKHNVQIDPNKAIVLTNRKKMGEIEPMRINKRPPIPQIKEVDETKSFSKVQEIEEVENNSNFFSTTVRDIEGVSLKVFKGERLEVCLSLNSLSPPVTDVKRLRLKLNEDRILLLLDNSRSLYDFCTPFLLDPQTVKSRLNVEKKSLALSVNIVFPS